MLVRFIPCRGILSLLLRQRCAPRVSRRLAALTGLSRRLATASTSGTNLSTFAVPLDPVAVLKKAEERYQHTHIKTLPNMTVHAYQSRYSAKVQQKLKESAHQNWLDGLTMESMLTTSSLFIHIHSTLNSRYSNLQGSEHRVFLT